MRIRIDALLPVSHFRATAVLSKTQRADSECEENDRRTGRPVPKLDSPTIRSATETRQVVLTWPIFAGPCGPFGRWKPLWQEKYRCSRANRLYSFRREVTTGPANPRCTASLQIDARLCYRLRGLPKNDLGNPGLRIRAVAERRDRLLDWIGRLLCRFGFHDYRLMEMVSGFGVGGHVQKVECRRCGYTTTRPG